jgi:hypothetical protein
LFAGLLSFSPLLLRRNVTFIKIATIATVVDIPDLIRELVASGMHSLTEVRHTELTVVETLGAMIAIQGFITIMVRVKPVSEVVNFEDDIKGDGS